jgi:hypothetical protein
MAIIELKKDESTGYDGWGRSGSSHFEFYATPEEIMLLFNTALGDMVSQFDIYGTFSRPLPLAHKYAPPKYEWIPFTYPLVDLCSCLSEYPDSINYYIMHKDWTPLSTITISIGEPESMNGCLLFQYFTIPNSRTKRISPFSINVVKKIKNYYTGEIIEYEEYVSIHNKLKKVYKKLFPYKTKYVVEPDYIHEDKNCRMSDGAVELYKQGTLYDHEPILDK